MVPKGEMRLVWIELIVSSSNLHPVFLRVVQYHRHQQGLQDQLHLGYLRQNKTDGHRMIVIIFPIVVVVVVFVGVCLFVCFYLSCLAFKNNVNRSNMDTVSWIGWSTINFSILNYYPITVLWHSDEAL